MTLCHVIELAIRQVIAAGNGEGEKIEEEKKREIQPGRAGGQREDQGRKRMEINKKQ